MSESHRIVLNITTADAIRSMMEDAGFPYQGEYMDDGTPLVVEWGLSDEDLTVAAEMIGSFSSPAEPAPDPDAFIINGSVHAAGDENCAPCWSGYPERHRCGGLMHGQFEDESYDPETGDEQVYLVYRCDGCAAEYDD